MYLSPLPFLFAFAGLGAIATALGAAPLRASEEPAASVVSEEPVQRPPSIDSRNPETVPVFTNLLRKGFTPRFIRHDPSIGLDVWFITLRDNTPQPVYATLDGKTLLGGQAWQLNTAGTDIAYLTGMHIMEAAAVLAEEGRFPTAAPDEPALPQPPSAPSSASSPPALPRPSVTAAALIAAFSGVPWIEAGHASAPAIYAVVDPECSFCHSLWQAIRPAVSAGRLRVRLIIAAPLGAKSLTSAAAILAAEDPVSAWDAHVDRRPASVPSADRLPEARAALARNEQMRVTTLDAAGLSGVPFLLYRSKDGRIGYQRGIDPRDAARLPDTVSDIDASPLR